MTKPPILDISFRVHNIRPITGIRCCICCGLVLSASSQWHYYVKSTKRNGKHQWQCKYCQMNWRQTKSGSRFVTIYDGEVCVQLILDEPPQAEYNIWMNQRIEYYMRLEPCEPVRDEIPVIPALLELQGFDLKETRAPQYGESFTPIQAQQPCCS